MNKPKKNNVVSFPSNISEIEREVEAILFAAAEPLDIESIESRISKKTNEGPRSGQRGVWWAD